jgi:ubiquinone biosynthesis protein
VRTVCEPIFDRPLKDISFGRILLRLFEISRRFNMQIQPQLMLLQKTLLNVEGLGRDLYPDLDVWSTATPILREWMRERTSVRTLARGLRTHVPELIEAAVRGVPALLTALIQREYARLQPPAAAQDGGELRAALERTARRRDAAIVGAALLLGGLVWLAMARDPAWLAWTLLAAGAVAILYGLWRAS